MPVSPGQVHVRVGQAVAHRHTAAASSNGQLQRQVIAPAAVVMQVQRLEWCRSWFSSAGVGYSGWPLYQQCYGAGRYSAPRHRPVRYLYLPPAGDGLLPWLVLPSFFHVASFPASLARLVAPCRRFLSLLCFFSSPTHLSSHVQAHTGGSSSRYCSASKTCTHRY